MGKRKETGIGRLELALLMLSDARFNLQLRRYCCAISRSYYACHHAARACLDAVGQPLQKSRAGAHFGKALVEIVERERSRLNVAAHSKKHSKNGKLTGLHA